MNSSRHQFIHDANLGLGARASLAPRRPFHCLSRGAKQSAAPTQSFVTGKSKHCMGRVTCDLGKGWDIEITFKNCTEAKFTGVELHPTSSRSRLNRLMSPVPPCGCASPSGWFGAMIHAVVARSRRLQST